MSNLVTSDDFDPDDLYHRLKVEFGDDLRKVSDALLDAIGVGMMAWIRAAILLRLFEELGGDTDDLNLGSTYYHLRDIAHGKLNPRIMVRFARRPQLISKISKLNPVDQRSLANGELIRLADPSLDENFRLVDPLHLESEEVALVFGPTRLRTVPEQIVILDRKRAEASRPFPMQFGPLLVDQDTGVITCTKKGQIPEDNLQQALEISRRIREGR